MERSNIITLVIGDRKAGKTTYLRGDKEIGIKGILEDYLETGRRILIVDRLDNQDWPNVPRIKPTDIRTFNGIAFIYSSHIYKLIHYIMRELYNSILVFEDATKYIEKTLDSDFETFCVESRQRNIDIFFIFHHLMAPPKDLIRIIDYIELFKTFEDWNDLKSKYPNPRIKNAFHKVADAKDPHFHLTIDKR